MPKSDKDLQNLLTLIPFLNSNQHAHIDRLAERWGCKRGEIAGYIDRLNLFGTDPYDPGSMIMATLEGGIMEISAAEQFKAPLHLTPSELLALRVALAPFAGARGYRHTIKSILAKLEAALLPQDRQAAEQLDKNLVFVTGDNPRPEVIKTLRQARANRKAAEIVYFSGSKEEVKKRVIEPYGFVVCSGQSYVAALCRQAGEVRTFKVSRIREITLTESGYEIPESFDINEYVRDGSLFRPTGQEKEVLIRFSSKVAPWILERSSDAKRNSDGSATLTLKANSFAWVARWILVYGPEAEILSPKEARDEVLKILDSGLAGRAI